MPCPICFSSYQLINKRLPRILTSCGHTLCSNCLQELITRTKDHFCKEFHCPICRHYYNQLDVESYPRNYALIDFIESHCVHLLSTKDDSSYLVPIQVAKHSHFIESVMG